MILCGENMDVSGGGVGEGEGCPPRKDIRRWGYMAGRANNSYVTIRNGA